MMCILNTKNIITDICTNSSIFLFNSNLILINEIYTHPMKAKDIITVDICSHALLHLLYNDY